MELVLRIVVLLVVLVGLITTIMSVKNWHWAQMVLLLFIFFSAIGTLILGLEVYRIHRTVRSGINPLKQQLADAQAENEALLRGTGDEALAGRIFDGQLPFVFAAEDRMPSAEVWTNRLQVQSRQRGRVWRGAAPQAIDPRTGRVAVAVPEPKPHGLEQGAILFAFEQGEPNVANPDQGAQFLGEFRVVQAAEPGVTLELVQGLDPRTMPRTIARLTRSVQTKSRPWSLYETMPADDHELFAGLSEEQLRQMIPAPSVNEYIRHGAPATDDDDDFHRAGFTDSGEKGQRVGPEDAEKAVEWRYDRTLRDYTYLFAELLRERVVKLALQAALTEDINRLKAALKSAQSLTAHREQKKQVLAGDLTHMVRDRQVIEQLLATIKSMIETARRQSSDLLAENMRLAQQLSERQLAELKRIDDAAPAPALPAAVSAN